MYLLPVAVDWGLEATAFLVLLFRFTDGMPALLFIRAEKAFLVGVEVGGELMVIGDSDLGDSGDTVAFL